MVRLPGAQPSARGGHSEFGLDLRDGTAFVVEEFVVDLAPAAELADLEQVLRGRELLRVNELRVDRAVAIFGPQFLTFVRPEELEEIFRRRLRRAFGDRDRSFDQDRRGRHDVFDVFAFFFGLDRLVLVAEQYVALALGEGGERVAGAARLRLGLFQHGLDRFQGLCGGLALVDRGAVDGHDVPASRAGAEWVRRDYTDVFGLQVVNGVNPLRVALADDEHDDRIGGD